ncbi:hypothetical protein Dimus_031808 [Dionaea muscipula]
MLVVVGETQKWLRSVALSLVNTIKANPDFLSDIETPAIQILESWKDKRGVIFCDEARKAQYYHWIKLLEVISRYRIHVEVSHLRLVVPISEAPHLWWRYLCSVACSEKKCGKDKIQSLRRLRRRYIQLYVGILQQSSVKDIEELRPIEKDLDSKVVLLWRYNPLNSNFFFVAAAFSKIVVSIECHEISI